MQTDKELTKEVLIKILESRISVIDSIYTECSAEALSALALAIKTLQDVKND
jgi:hypothetical protein